MHDVCSIGRGQMTINQAISETLQLTHRELAGVIVTLKSRKEIDLRRVSHKNALRMKIESSKKVLLSQSSRRAALIKITRPNWYR